MVKNLGEWAEQRFALLCAESGVTCNKSQQDKTGWDFLVEFAPIVVPNIPHDMRPTDRSARVQVKSTRGSKYSTRLKLSNALRFANDPSPCFVVFLVPQTEDAREKIFVRHFDESLIELTLRKAREAASEGRSDLHKIMLPITFLPTDDHSADLMDWMAVEIPQRPAAYASAKAAKVQNLGFADGFLTGTITFKASSLEDIVDHQLGLSEHVEVENISISNVRFGIEIPIENLGKPTTARITPHPRPCRVRVRNHKSNDIWLDGQIFVPAHFGPPPEHLKFRIEADFLKIISNGDQPSNLSAHFTHDDKCTLEGLVARLSFQAMIQEGPIDVQAFFDNIPFIGFAGKIEPAFASEWPARLLEVLEPIAAATSDFRPTELRLSANDLYQAWPSLADFHGLVKGLDLKAKIGVVEPFPIDGITVLLAYGYTSVGDWNFSAVVSREIISKDWIDGKLAIACGAPRILEAIVRQGDLAGLIADTVVLHERTRSSLGSGVMEMCDGDYTSMVMLPSSQTSAD